MPEHPGTVPAEPSCICHRTHYIQKGRDCQANFNFSRNTRKNKGRSCHISVNFSRSSGFSARSSAPASASSSLPRKPQVQPMECTPAFLAVRMSTLESPIMTACSGVMPAFSKITEMISGEGFLGRLSLLPRI